MNVESRGNRARGWSGGQGKLAVQPVGRGEVWCLLSG